MVFIPAYRCRNQISRVLAQFDEAAQNVIDTVVVVDNQSPDDTLAVAIAAGEERFRYCNFVAWENNENYGLGGSHKAAFRYAIQQGFDYLIVLHGDDQANIQDILPFLAREEHTRVDCLLGARFMKGSRLQGYSWLRTVGNRVYNFLFSVAAGHRIFDLGSGLNMYKLEAYQDFYYKKFPDDLTFNYVMLLASYHRRQKIEFFPISWREEDQVSNVRLFRQAFKVLNLLGSFIMRREAFLEKELRNKPFVSYEGSIQRQQEKVR